MTARHDLIATYCRVVRQQPTQDAADHMAATLWPTVAVAAPGDAQLARDALRDAAAGWSGERAS